MEYCLIGRVLLKMYKKDYHAVRMTYDQRRTILWHTLVKEYFQKYIKKDDCVLELGAGYGDFINSISARKKVAIDIWEDMQKYLNSDVEAITGDATSLDKVEDNSVDFVFASNFFEHLSQEDIEQYISCLRKIMKDHATLNILQPNFKYAYREYFDDYTHKTIFTENGLCGFLEANGYEIIECIPRFLPLTIKSKIPIHPLLVKIYLRFPVKIMAKQMFIRAQIIK